MKQLSLLSHMFVESTPSAPVNKELAAALTRAAHENRKKVIVAALFIEREIEAIIGFYLFPDSRSSEQKMFVEAEILGSDALSFSHKKRLITSLVHQKVWLQGDAKAAFDKGLREMISLRNAFAHGNIIVRDHDVFLDYFEGRKKRVELTDSYLSAIENSFNSVVERIEMIKAAAGLPAAPQSQPA